VRLPFLKEKDHWPTAKDNEERVVNPSPDAQMQDHAVDQLLSALESRDPTEIRKAILDLVHSIIHEDQDDV
jgi:hypothetical protein